ncbi:MAG: hypothetical protein R2875_14005 [Desulfobacterales bacterium]
MQDLDKLGDENIVMVMQGFVDGIKYITPTLVYPEYPEKSPSCDSKSRVCDSFNAGVYIDPQAFAPIRHHSCSSGCLCKR